MANNLMQEKVLSELRVSLAIRTQGYMGNVKKEFPDLSPQQYLFIEGALVDAGIQTLRHVMELTPQQFNAVRTK